MEERFDSARSAGKNTRPSNPRPSGPPKVFNGDRIDQYRIIRPLGQGGMGVVYLARDTQLGRKVALKLLQGHIDIKRFVTEGRITAQFNHPHIVTLYAVGTHGKVPYMALEYLQGQTLKERIKSSPPRLGEALQLARDITSALTEAHGYHVAHLDLKPTNIITPLDGRLRVLDFGLASVTQASNGNKKTPSSGLQGTPAYMAPEQWSFEPTGAATDIWALGVILYEMLAGQRPFKAYETTPEAFSDAVCSDQPIPPIDVPSEVWTLLTSCLERKMSDRPTATEVEADLQTMLDRLQGRTGTGDRAARTESPYRGLLPFDAAQSSLFFGREAEITELSERLRHTPVVPVIGPSGVGKSSLIRAGLIPRLTSLGGWTMLEMRPGPRPFQSLKACLDQSNLRASTTETRSWTDLQAHPELLGLELEERTQTQQARFLIFVDQMEEIFTLTEDPEVATAFLRALTSAADDLQEIVRVTFTLRNDYFVRASESHPAIAEALRRPFFVHTPGRSALTETLTGPLRATHYRFDDGLVDTMVDAVGQKASLPLLQFTAHRLWEERDKDQLRLTTAAYEQMGGVSGALIQHGDRVLDALGPEDTPVARDLLLRMVTSEETRRVVPSTEALEGLGPPGKRVLDALIAARLVTTTRIEGAAALELAHESLIQNWNRLRAWIDAERDDLRFLAEAKAAAELWERRGRRDNEVWTQEALAEAKALLAKCTLPVPNLVQAFIAAGVARERRQVVRRRSIVTAAMAFLTVVAVVLFVQRKQAVEHAARAEANHAQAESERALARREAAGARNASRLATATLHRSDPTLALSLVREMEASGPLPPQWRELARWATYQTIAEVVLTHETGAYLAEFSPDDTRILSISLDEFPRVWPADGSGPPLILRGHEDRVGHSSFSPDGKRIVTASYDKTVRLWMADGSAPPIVLRGHEGRVFHAAFSPDGRRIVTGSQDGTVRVWPVDGSGTPIVIRPNSGRIFWTEFSPDGKRIAITSDENVVHVWPADNSGPPLILRGHEGHIYSAEFSPDGKYIVSASFDETARIWRADGTGTPIVLRGHQGHVHSAVFSPDGKRIVTSSTDRTARVWNADGSGTPIVLRGHQHQVSSAFFNSDGTRVVTAGQDKTVRVWRIDRLRTPVTLRGHKDIVFSAAFSPDNRRIITGCYDGIARIWQADGSGTPILLKGHEKSVYSGVFSPDGTRVATSSFDQTARIWAADGTGTPIILRGHKGHVYSVAFSPDGTRVVTAAGDQTVRVWNTDGSGTPLILRGHEDVVFTASFSPNSQRIVTGSRDKTMRVWNADGSGTPLVVRGHEATVYTAAFSPDGKRIVTGSFDETARVWQLDSPNADGSLPFVELRGHNGALGAGMIGGQGAFSPDGARIVTMADDRTIRIWNADGTGKPAILRIPELDSNGVAFSPDGKRIVTVSHSERNPDTGKMEYWATVWQSFEPFTGLDDPDLWTTTRYCPPVELRIDLLGMSTEEAELQYQRCQKRVTAAVGQIAQARP